MQIDHDPDEKRPTNRIWWAAWAIVALLWVWYLYFFDPDWPSIGVGAFTMGILATWAIEITGNKVPDSWRGKSSRS